MTHRVNNILRTDSYKLGHHGMLPPGTTNSHMHLAAREGPGIPWTYSFGLQPILDSMSGAFATRDMLEEAADVAAHNMPRGVFNFADWERIVQERGGMLPLEIRAVPEGTKVPRGNALMTVEATDKDFAWLPGYVESRLMKVWYPTTVATRAVHAYEFFFMACERSGTDWTWAQYMLQDFGYRGNATDEGAAIAGAAHLIGSRGTDTLLALPWLRDHYGCSIQQLGLSVQASQHEVMTALGPKGEGLVLRRLVAENAGRILSAVADSYNYAAFVSRAIDMYETVASRQVSLVIRPDSVTKDLPTPKDIVLWTLLQQADRLAKHVTATRTGHKIVPYKVLYGDGHDSFEDIYAITNAAIDAGFAAQNLVFGAGGLVHQKLDRDTFRFAIKCSAMERDGKWHDAWKETPGKASLRGRLTLVAEESDLADEGVEPHVFTARRDTPLSPNQRELMRPVFRDGVVLARQTFGEIRRFD